MNKSKNIILCFLLLGMGFVLNGQDRKDIRDKNITTITVQEYFIEEGLKEPLVESIEKFNEDGEIVELKEFNKRGDVTKWEQYKYDEDRNLIEQVFLDSRGKVKETEKIIYEDGFRVEKQYYNDKDKLYKKKVYLYEYR